MKFVFLLDMSTTSNFSVSVGFVQRSVASFQNHVASAVLGRSEAGCENSGTPKSSILIGFSIINHPFWGTPIFGNIQLALRRTLNVR